MTKQPRKTHREQETARRVARVLLGPEHCGGCDLPIGPDITFARDAHGPWHLGCWLGKERES